MSPGTPGRARCPSPVLASRRRILLAAAALGTGCAAGAPPTAAGGTGDGADRARKGLRAAVRSRATAALPAYAPRRLREMRDRLAPLHERTTAPKPGEWRADHPETGQTFEEYVTSGPTAPTTERRTLVVAPLGGLDEARTRILGIVAEALTAHFGLPARIDPVIEPGPPPRGASRTIGRTRQLRSGWLLEGVLAPQLPPDAAALLGFTSEDLWPGQDWNFVFGEASLQRRVGVWSLHRHGDPASPGMFRIALRRALKTALHETGHMFSLQHCTRWRCLQAGINSLEEEDRAPLWACPVCLAKIAWVTSSDPRERLDAMAALCRRVDLVDEARHFDRDRAALA